MKDTEIHLLIDDKIEKSMPNCALHNDALLDIQKKLSELVTYNECNYKILEKHSEKLETHDTDITVIKTERKVLLAIAGVFGAVAGWFGKYL